MTRAWIFVLDLLGRREKIVEIHLDGREYRFGSDGGCEITVRRDAIEPVHCVLFGRDGSARLKNLAATRSTMYNGMRMGTEEIELRNGDVFNVGGRSFAFSTAGLPIPKTRKRPRSVADVPRDMGDYAFLITGFDARERERLVGEIESAGGFVLNTLQGAMSRIAVFVIAPRPLATLKYLYAEIADLTCVVPDFVARGPESVRARFTRCRLPRLVPGVGEVRLDLTGTLLGLYRMDGDRSDLETLVTAAGGSVVDDQTAPWTAKPAAVLTNLAPGDPELEAAIASGVPVVHRGDAWIARAATEGRAPPFDAYST